MPRMMILTEKELRAQVRLDADAVACVEEAFAALATRPVVMPPILRLDIAEHRGECVMARERTVVVGAFHPELTDDPAVHQYFADLVRRSSGAPGAGG